MNKTELAEALAENQCMTFVMAKACIDAMFDCMVESLAAEDDIEIRGLFSMKVKRYKAYLGRNPQSGEVIPVAEKKLPVFKASKMFDPSTGKFEGQVYYNRR